MLYLFRYGLILPKKQQLKTVPKLNNIFGDDNASDEDNGTDWVKKALKAEGEKNKMKKQTKLDIQKALNEDPTIYMYDEVYDNIEHTKGQLEVNKQKEKKPRYIENLLKTAERRKKEQEHRIERMVQKEREAEGEMYADKESFVTSAYKAKLEEFKKMEEEEARMSRLEAIGDVTKQKDISGFYRHLYRQTVECQVEKDDGGDKTKEADTEQEEKESLANDANESENDTMLDSSTNMTSDRLKTPVKSKKRHYRQRIIETYESDTEIEPNEEIKTGQTTTPADEDSDKGEAQEPEKKKQKQDLKDVETDKCIANAENEDSNVQDAKISPDSKTGAPEDEKIVDTEKPVIMKDKSIWKKRTVGAVFEAALQRYYARKAMR